MIIFTFGKYAAKRKTVGISGSKFYSKVKAGGAYILNTAGNIIVRMPIRRLKEQTERQNCIIYLLLFLAFGSKLVSW